MSSIHHNDVDKGEGGASTADVLRDLARVKAAFQLRTIEAVIRGPVASREKLP